MPCIAWSAFPRAYKTQVELLDALVKHVPESDHLDKIIRIATCMCHRETRISY